MAPELACGHVLDHALTQRADGGIGTHGELLLSEATKTSIFPQDGAPRPHYGLLSTGYQPSIGHPAQRLSRQRFSALAQTGDPRCRGNRVRYRRRTGPARAAPGRPRRQPDLTQSGPYRSSPIAMQQRDVMRAESWYP